MTEVVRELKKEIQIDCHRFELHKMPANIVSWIYSFLLTSLLKAQQDMRTENIPQEGNSDVTPQEKADGTVQALWMTCASVIDENQHSKVQSHALKAVRYFIGDDAAMLVMQDGRIADDVVRNNPVLYNKLVLASLQFNLAPFFVEAASIPKQA